MKPNELDAFLAAQFHAADADRDGAISPAEFAAYYAGLGTCRARQQLRSIMGVDTESAASLRPSWAKCCLIALYHPCHTCDSASPRAWLYGWDSSGSTNHGTPDALTLAASVLDQQLLPSLPTPSNCPVSLSALRTYTKTWLRACSATKSEGHERLPAVQGRCLTKIRSGAAQRT